MRSHLRSEIYFPPTTSPRVSHDLAICAPSYLNLKRTIGYLTSSGPESLSSEPSGTPGSSFSPNGCRNVSGFRIMTITRGFTEEADKLLNLLVRYTTTFGELFIDRFPLGDRNFRCYTKTVLAMFHLRCISCMWDFAFLFSSSNEEQSQDDNDPNKFVERFSRNDRQPLTSFTFSIVEAYTFNFTVRSNLCDMARSAQP